VCIAYQIFKAAEHNGTDPFRDFPDQFNELAKQYEIVTEESNPKFDYAQYMEQMKLTINMLGILVQKQSTSLTPRKSRTLKLKMEAGVNPAIPLPTTQQQERTVIRPKRRANDLTGELF
jgi:hypothetical protein